MPGERKPGQDHSYYEWSPVVKREPLRWPVLKTILAPPIDRGAENGTPASDAARFTGRRHRTVTTSFRHRRLRFRCWP